MKYRLLWAGAMGGLLTHFAGLGWDVYRHSSDSTLAQREDVLSLTNLSHLMIVVGMSIVAACLMGILAAWMHDRNFGGRGLFGNGLRSVALPVIAVASASSIWVASQAEDSGHDHGPVAAHEDHSHHPPVLDPGIARALDPLVAAAVVTADGHSHDVVTVLASADGGPGHHAHHNEVSVTAEQLTAAADFVEAVKEQNAEKYADIEVALAEGFVQITGDQPGIAAHFMCGACRGDGLEMDPSRPEFLLYTKRLDGEWRLIGVMFTANEMTEEPPSYFGPLDAWHYHTNRCYKDGLSSSAMSQAECPGGLYVAKTGWMLHVWTMEGATGAFAHDFAPITPGAFPGASQLAATELRAQAR